MNKMVKDVSIKENGSKRVNVLFFIHLQRHLFQGLY